MWVKIDDLMPHHPKVVGLSDRAFREYIVALAYANRYMTDGFVPAALLPAPRIVRELREAGLWDGLDDGRDGVLIHDYLDFQPSRDDAVESRGVTAAGRRRGGKVRAASAIRNADGTFVGTDDDTMLGDAGSDAGTSIQPASSSASPAGDPAAIQPRTRTRTRTPKDQTLALATRERARDEVFEVVAEVCGIVVGDLTDEGRGVLNRATAQLKKVGATPDEIRRRAGNWPFDATMTPSALVKHYASLSTPPARSSSSLAFQIARQLQAEGR